MAAKPASNDPAASAVVYRAATLVYHGTTGDDQRYYAAGDDIPLSDERAAPLLACGAIEPVSTPPE